MTIWIKSLNLARNFMKLVILIFRTDLVSQTPFEIGKGYCINVHIWKTSEVIFNPLVPRYSYSHSKIEYSCPSTGTKELSTANIIWARWRLYPWKYVWGHSPCDNLKWKANDCPRPGIEPQTLGSIAIAFSNWAKGIYPPGRETRTAIYIAQISHSTPSYF